MLITAAASTALNGVAYDNRLRRLWAFWQDSIVELRKVVWPTKQETIHSTCSSISDGFYYGIGIVVN